MSVIICGYWLLTGGQRRKPANSKTHYYNYYNSAIGLREGSLPCEIRVYSPFGNVPLQDDTVAFVYGRIALPEDSSAIVEAIDVVPGPGDPDDDDYQESQIDYPWPIFSVVGTVKRIIEPSVSEHKIFVVSTTEYVRDDNHTFQIAALLHKDNKLWTNTVMPRVGSVVFFTGHGFQYDVAYNMIVIQVESLKQPVGPSSSSGGNVSTTRFAVPSFTDSGSSASTSALRPRSLLSQPSSSKTKFATASHSSSLLATGTSHATGKAEKSTLGMIGGALQPASSSVSPSKRSRKTRSTSPLYTSTNEYNEVDANTELLVSNTNLQELSDSTSSSTTHARKKKKSRTSKGDKLPNIKLVVSPSSDVTTFQEDIPCSQDNDSIVEPQVAENTEITGTSTSPVTDSHDVAEQTVEEDVAQPVVKQPTKRARRQ